MAEVYGIKPKMFTKEWWPYFWMYYKWHTIGIVFVFAAVIFTVAQCVMSPEYDLSITYSGHPAFGRETGERFASDMSQLIEDVDGNGEKSINFQNYEFMDVAGSEEYDSAMKTKLDMELYSEQSFIYILDSKELAAVMSNDYYADVYAPVSEWADNAPDDILWKKDGGAYAVSLSRSAYLNSLGVKSDDMYIVLKNHYQDGKFEAAAFEESKKIANALIKE